jgi:hypothetical protein
MLQKIVSGGQTGVDRAGLDAAMEAGIPIGGYCPKGRLAEDGTVPDMYPLIELTKGGYKARTEKNVVESDGTLILNIGKLTGGIKLIVEYMTKRDLTSWGSFLFMGLIGVVIASVVNIFVGSSAVSWVISGIGVIVFTGLTAYDTWKIKELAAQGTEGRKPAILGALTLYLDFINLFLMLLRFTGSRR